MVSTEATFSNITGLQTATLLKKKQKILFFNCNLIKKEILARVFSCQFCKVSKNPFFIEHLQAACECLT